MEIIFIAEGQGLFEKMALPIVTEVGELTRDSGDEEFKTANGKTLTLIGSPGLRNVTISSFFPSKLYSFVPLFKYRLLNDYIRFFEKYLELNVPIRVIIYTDGRVALNMLCRYTFSYSFADSVGNIPYTLTLKEYVDPRSITGGYYEV